MELGAIFATSADTADHIAVAEELGYGRAMVYDSPAFLADAWMTLARAAERTSAIRLGVGVITPRLRHLVANAGALAMLHTLAPGRVEVVVGAGFTSQLMLGKGPARWSDVEAYVNGLRSLLRGEDIEWDGAVIGLRYGARSGVELPGEIPIFVAAHGPKGYAVGARSADGVITNPGHGANNTVLLEGRDTLVLLYGTVLRDGEGLDSERVLDATGPYAAFQLHLGEDGMLAGSPAPAALMAKLEGIDESRRHLELHRGHLIEVTELERPLITPELIGRSTETGTPEALRARLDELASSGVTGVLYAPMGSDIPGELATFAEVALAH
jgi:5,10-methylenetetrahydromethanopterin reductase